MSKHFGIGGPHQSVSLATPVFSGGRCSLSGSLRRAVSAIALLAVALLCPTVVFAQADGVVGRLPDGRKPRYLLGVHYEPTPSGLRVTGVIRNTPAWRLGLEPGDYITRVDGQRVGIVDGLNYPLAQELQRSNGTVELRIWDCRARRYESHIVRLSPR